MSPEYWGLMLLGSLFVVIMIGFPISFTLYFSLSFSVIRRWVGRFFT